MARWTRKDKWGVTFRLGSFFALILPIIAAFVLSYIPSKRYEGVVWLILDVSRGSQTVAGIDERRSGNEVVTYDQVLRTQLAIAGSDDVVRRAVEHMRPARLYPELLAGDVSEAEFDRTEAAAARANMILSLEPNTFVFKLAFRHRDPVLAARFANLLATEFLVRRSSLSSNSGDVDFFKAQEARFNDDLRVGSTAMEEFGRRFSIYSITEQRRLLLERRAFAAKEASDNATQVARVESELNSLKVQITALRRQTTLPPEIFGEPTQATSAARTTRSVDILSNDPPLLNIKIYQESAAKLVSANAELEGLKATRAQRVEVLKQIDADLQKLGSNEATYNALRRAVSQAEAAIENLTKRAGEARVNNAWRSNEAFSSAQILQAASVPSAPVSPKPALYIPAGVIVGIFASLVVLFAGQRLGFLSLGFARIGVIPDAIARDQAPVGLDPVEPVGRFGRPAGGG
ncbi:GumC family protein [Methylobacterium sp. CM6247]